MPRKRSDGSSPDSKSSEFSKFTPYIHEQIWWQMQLWPEKTFRTQQCLNSVSSWWSFCRGRWRRACSIALDEKSFKNGLHWGFAFFSVSSTAPSVSYLPIFLTMCCLCMESQNKHCWQPLSLYRWRQERAFWRIACRVGWKWWVRFIPGPDREVRSTSGAAS